MEEGAFLVDGPVLLAEALEAGLELEACYAEPGALHSPEVESARGAGVAVHEVEEGVLARVLDLRSPQQVVAVAALRPADAGSIWRAAVEGGRPVLVVVALQDPGNAGTLVRVAEAAGCAGVVMTSGSVDVHNPKCVRASAGSLFRVPVADGLGIDDVIAAAGDAAVPLVATAGRGGSSPEQVDLSGTVGLCVGSEAHGLPEDLLRVARTTVTIPMEGRVESLNAAVAGAVLAFEAARQRRVGATGHPTPGTAGAEPAGGGGAALGHDVGP